MKYPVIKLEPLVKLRLTSGVPNVIPGKVKLSLEIRDLDESKIDFLFREIEKS